MAIAANWMPELAGWPEVTATAGMPTAVMPPAAPVASAVMPSAVNPTFEPCAPARRGSVAGSWPLPSRGWLYPLTPAWPTVTKQAAAAAISTAGRSSACSAPKITTMAETSNGPTAMPAWNVTDNSE